MPSILEQLAADQHMNRTCRLCDWVSRRSKAEREEWLIAISDKRKYGHSAIARLIAKLDPDARVTADIIMNHRSMLHRIEA